jgi:integrase
MKVRHLVEKRTGAGILYYWQPAGPLRAAGWRAQRLLAPEGTPIRDRAEAAAAAERLNAEVDAWRQGEAPPNAPPAMAARGKRAAPGSVEALVAEYKTKEWWTRLAPKTKAEYGWALDAIIGWAGDLPARAITPPAVQAFYESQRRRVVLEGRKRRVIETPAKGAAAVRVLRLLMAAAERLGYRPAGTNPAKDPGISLQRQREPLLWSAAEVAHMAATADKLGWRSVATGILLNEWIGQRMADLLLLRPWASDTEALRLRQGKTGRQVVLPVYLVPHLVARLKAERERPGAVASTERLLLNDSTGQAWNEHTFRHVFADIREAAAKTMPSCSGLILMELRHTAVTRLDEAGVDPLGIAGITGHSPATVRQILDKHYLVRTEKAATRAFRARLAAESEEG